MRRAQRISWIRLSLGIGAIIAAGFSAVASAERPGAVPPTGLPESAPPFGLPDSAPPFGRGKGFVNGKGKGLAVARVSYHCLGVQKQAFNQGAAFSYLADSIVSDAGGTGLLLLSVPLAMRVYLDIVS